MPSMPIRTSQFSTANSPHDLSYTSAGTAGRSKAEVQGATVSWMNSGLSGIVYEQVGMFDFFLVLSRGMPV